MLKETMRDFKIYFRKCKLVIHVISFEIVLYRNCKTEIYLTMHAHIHIILLLTYAFSIIRKGCKMERFKL